MTTSPAVDPTTASPGTRGLGNASSPIRSSPTRGPLPYPVRTLKLYLAQKDNAYLAPVLILCAVVVFSVLVGLVIGIVTGFPLPAEVSAGFRTNNLGVIWALPGFFVSSAALSVNRTFATVLALGGTRRDFWLGTTAGFLVTSLVTAVTAVVLLGIERLTDGWFLGVRALSVGILGDGNPALVFLTVMLLALAGFHLGAACGTVFRAYGAKVLTAIIAGMTLALVGVIALAVWQWETTLRLATGAGDLFVPLILLALVLVGAAGSLLALRRATV